MSFHLPGQSDPGGTLDRKEFRDKNLEAAIRAKKEGKAYNNSLFGRRSLEDKRRGRTSPRSPDTFPRPPAPKYESRNREDLIWTITPEDMDDTELSATRMELIKLYTKNQTELEFLKERGETPSAKHIEYADEILQRINDLELERDWRSSRSGQNRIPGSGIPQTAAAPADASQASLASGFRPSVEGGLEEVIQNAYQSLVAPISGTSRMAGDPFNPGQMTTEAIPGQDYGPAGNAVARMASFLTGGGDDAFFGAGPAGPASAAFQAFPTKGTTARAAEGVRGAGGQAYDKIADIAAFLFDKEAPGRGIHLARGTLAPRARAEGAELMVRNAKPVFAQAGGKLQQTQTAGALQELFKGHPDLAQAVAEALTARGITVEDFVKLQAGAYRRGPMSIEDNQALIAEIGTALRDALGPEAASLITGARGPVPLGSTPGKIVPLK